MQIPYLIMEKEVKFILSLTISLFVILSIQTISAETPISEIPGPTPYGVGIIAFNDHGKMYFPQWIGLDYSVSNDSGDTIYSETCDPYGKVIRSSGDKITSHGCFGRYFDEDLAASYVDGNWYDPSMGSQIDNGNFGPMEMIRGIYFVGKCGKSYCETAGEVAAGLYQLVRHPVDTTATMLQPGFEVYYSNDRWGTVKGYGIGAWNSVVAAWDRDHAYFLGGLGFEFVSVFIPGDEVRYFGKSKFLVNKIDDGGLSGGGGAGTSKIITDPRRMLPVGKFPDTPRTRKIMKHRLDIIEGDYYLRVLVPEYEFNEHVLDSILSRIENKEIPSWESVVDTIRTGKLYEQSAKTIIFHKNGVSVYIDPKIYKVRTVHGKESISRDWKPVK